jgi:hypothetical protein
MRRREFPAHLLLQSNQPGADFLSDFIDRTHATDNYKLTFGSIISRDSPDDSRTGVNIRAFAALQQD